METRLLKPVLCLSSKGLLLRSRVRPRRCNCRIDAPSRVPALKCLQRHSIWTSRLVSGDLEVWGFLVLFFLTKFCPIATLQKLSFDLPEFIEKKIIWKNMEKLRLAKHNKIINKNSGVESSSHGFFCSCREHKSEETRIHPPRDFATSK